MKLLAALLIAALAFVPSPALAAEPVYVIRHLEKAQGDDPPLTEEGTSRARQLADLLFDRGIAAIFATRTRRAMETAAPLASRLGIAVTPYDARDPGSLVKAAAASAGPILVVGHSNTVPDLVERFGGPEQAPLVDDDYGTIFIVAPDGQVTRLELR